MNKIKIVSKEKETNKMGVYIDLYNIYRHYVQIQTFFIIVFT